ncbi:MAG: hypothetical protein QOH83_2172, partial [Solirubrobacteraceae bacterium]|nr:hypothetical protein [Solirubrobacteraceae bacterium]
GGNDILDGEGEDDTIITIGGSNTIRGGAGNDTIWSGYLTTSDIDCGDGVDTVYAGNITLGRGERGTPRQIQDPLVREPQVFKDCETLIPVTVRASPLSNEYLNPQFIDPLTQEGKATNAGLLKAGPPGAQAVADVKMFNSSQPRRRYGRATNDNDSLTVTTKHVLDPDGGLYGKAGNDRLEGAAGDDRLYGGSGNDGLYGRGGDDVLFGGTGGDTLEGARGEDLLDGGPGNDKLNGGFGDDSISGGSGNDAIVALGGGRDTIDCGPGNDRVIADKTDTLKNCEQIE